MYQSSPGVLLNQNMYHLWGRADGAEFIGNKQTDTQLYNTLIHRPTSVFFAALRRGNSRCPHSSPSGVQKDRSRGPYHACAFCPVAVDHG